MKLTDRTPRWVVDAERRRIGVRFDCPCSVCVASDDPLPLSVPFANPLDGADPDPRGWQREGDTFEGLTVSPSILMRNGPGEHWHGWLKNGELTS